MKTQIFSRHFGFACLLAAVLLLVSCSPTSSTPTEEEPDQPILTEEGGAMETPDPTMTSVDLDYTLLAQDVSVETVPAQPAGPDAPYWASGPEYSLITLQGYPITNHFFPPQIFIYPVADMSASNEGMGMMAADLEKLLGSENPGETMPYLPLYNAAQVFHTQVQYLDFTNGSGVRFLTQFSQGFVKINNYDLIYTFQGLSSDGKYYIAAVLPVTHPDLPDDNIINDDDLADDIPAYIASLAATLDQQPADSFFPNLNLLDAMIQSIEIR